MADLRPALFSRPVPIALFILLAVALDQVVKVALSDILPFEQSVPLLPVLALYLTHNYGVAFSMLSGMETEFIIALRLVVVAFVLWLWKKTPKHRALAHLGYAMIIAGAIGNLIDKLIFGYVVDYILFHTETWSFAVFNLADSYITIGAGAIILDEVLPRRETNA